MSDAKATGGGSAGTDSAGEGTVGGAKDIQLQGLDLITQGINLALDELRETGMLGEAAMGRGFSDLALSGLELGHDGLTTAFDSFCERWEWGVRALVQEGSGFADAVGLSAGTIHEFDEYIAGTLKISANAVMGNPHLSEDEVTKMSWDDIRANHALADADWSKESWDRAQENVDQTWNDTQRDVLTSPVLDHGPVSPQESMGMTDQQYEAWLDQQYGPSAEERAQAGEGQAEAAGQQQDGSGGR